MAKKQLLRKKGYKSENWRKVITLLDILEYRFSKELLC